MSNFRCVVETLYSRNEYGNADARKLQPAYDRINAAVRAADAERLLFFAGVTWDDAGPGFTAPPGGAAFANRSVLAFHYYEGPQIGPDLQLAAQRAGAARLGVGLFLTETAGGGSGRRGDQLFDACDAARTSYAHWQSTGGWKPFCRESAATPPTSSKPYLAVSEIKSPHGISHAFVESCARWLGKRVGGPLLQVGLVTHAHHRWGRWQVSTACYP